MVLMRAVTPPVDEVVGMAIVVNRIVPAVRAVLVAIVVADDGVGVFAHGSNVRRRVASSEQAGMGLALAGAHVIRLSLITVDWRS